ncbi:DUF2075 domain-containing protein [Sporolactobacillus vineae]|uniref:DUF2075 domain-containing protein n=1 Tax=Sporolactobacillus vineae TaxID=444463 RepID=UPI000287E32F|nr:DUF2075 domain-containing protein [Sporolactobacillus vineae]
MNTSQTEVSSTNSSIFKLSPFKTLSPEQSALKEKVIRFCREHVRAGSPALFVIRGRAGTGKSVVLSAVFNEIQHLSRSGAPDDPVSHTDNRLIVNHAEMFKLYRELSEDLPDVRKKDIDRPTPFINRLDRNHQTADIVLIDEAHLLLTKRDSYNRFNQENQLLEIIRRSRVVILVFDDRQVLKMKSYWNEAALQRFIAQYPCEEYRLTRQFRIHAEPDVSEWISGFVHKKLLPLPKKQRFDFRIFEDAGEMYHLIKEKNSACGLSRMIATYDYPYKLDGQDHFIHEKNFTLRWDRSKPNERKPWAERPESIDEVGSVYTIQGFDLNFAGVILGPSVVYDESCDQIAIDTKKYEDQAAFTRRDDVPHPEAVKEQIILNSINVLLTRGMRGLYIYAGNPELRKRLATL